MKHLVKNNNVVILLELSNKPKDGNIYKVIFKVRKLPPTSDALKNE